MTWQRHWQLSAESQSLADVAGLGGSGYDISSTQAYTGTYSYRNASNDAPMGMSGMVAPAVRCNFMLRHNGALSNTLLLPIVGMVVDGANLAWFWRQSSNEITLLAGYDISTSGRRFAVTVTDDALASVDTWYSIGMVAYMHASAGYVSLYVDGMQIATWTGDTRLYRSGEATPRTSINAVYAAGAAAGWNLAIGDRTVYANYGYVDDFYADTGDGTEGDTAPTTRRFFPRFRAASADVQAQMTPVGAATNGECIDDAPPDGDTTYVLAGGAGLKDIYPLTDVTLPDNYAPRAVIVLAYAKKTDAGVASTLTPGLYDAVQGSLAGTAQTLPTDYGYVGYRFTGSMLGGAWTEEMVNDTAMAVESSGDYS